MLISTDIGEVTLVLDIYPTADEILVRETLIRFQARKTRSITYSVLPCIFSYAPQTALSPLCNLVVSPLALPQDTQWIVQCTVGTCLYAGPQINPTVSASLEWSHPACDGSVPANQVPMLATWTSSCPRIPSRFACSWISAQRTSWSYQTCLELNRPSYPLLDNLRRDNLALHV